MFNTKQEPHDPAYCQLATPASRIMRSAKEFNFQEDDAVQQRPRNLSQRSREQPLVVTSMHALQVLGALHLLLDGQRVF
jgi:hypothetical protein